MAEWTGDASPSSGIALISVSVVMFLLSFNIIGLFSFECFQFHQSMNTVLNAFIQIPATYQKMSNTDNLGDVDRESDMDDDTLLPLALLLPLSSITALFWLIVKYVSLRLHLGRN